LRRQTVQETLPTAGPEAQGLSGPSALPMRLCLADQGPAGGSNVYLDRTQAIVKRRSAGVPLTVVVPMSMFDGVMVSVMPGESFGTVKAKLVLRHRDPALCITLAETDTPEQLSTVWPAWSKHLELPMLVCDLAGNVQPIEAFSVKQDAPPAPRRRLALLTGRRPRFLTRRKTGTRSTVAPVYRGEREITARS